MTARNWNWAVGDQVAIHDFVGTPYLLGTITHIRPDGMLYIDLGATTAPAVRYPDDVRVVPADQVPIDQRHWVPALVRDQMVRLEAADRLRAMFALVEVPPHRRVDDVLAAISCPGADRVAAARALLTPTRQEVSHAEPLVVSP